MKKYLFIFLFISLFIACKKENKQQPLLDIAGTWAPILETDSTADHTVSQFISATAYPCIDSNIFIIHADGTSVSKFIGKNACSIGSSAYFGEPGQDSVPSTWRRVGNVIRFTVKYGSGYTQNTYGVASTVNNKLHLFLRDTVSLIFPSPPPTNPPHMQTEILVKQ